MLELLVRLLAVVGLVAALLNALIMLPLAPPIAVLDRVMFFAFLALAAAFLYLSGRPDLITGDSDHE